MGGSPRHCWGVSDTRGVSSTVSYVLNLGILLVLFISMLYGASAFVDSSSDASTRKALETTGQSVAGTIEAVDRLNRSTSSSVELGQRISLPDEIRGNSYRITITDGDDSGMCDPDSLQIESNDIQESISFVSCSEVAETDVQGGDLYVVRPEGTDSPIELRPVDE